MKGKKMQIIESATNINKGMTLTFENGYRAIVSRNNGRIDITLFNNSGRNVRPNTNLYSVLKQSARKFLKI
jgi:hypothetical protein